MSPLQTQCPDMSQAPTSQDALSRDGGLRPARFLVLPRERNVGGVSCPLSRDWVLVNCFHSLLSFVGLELASLCDTAGNGYDQARGSNGLPSPLVKGELDQSFN